jgi:hypothetical protein
VKQKTKRVDGDIKENKESREYADENNGLHAGVGGVIKEFGQTPERIEKHIP